MSTNISKQLEGITDLRKRIAIIERELWHKFPKEMQEIDDRDISLSKELMLVKPEHDKKVRDQLAFFIKKIEVTCPDFIKDAKKRYLQSKIDFQRDFIKLAHDTYEANRIGGMEYKLRKAFYNNAEVPKHEKRLKSLVYALCMIENSKEIERERITDFMIERAREYPISDLIKIQRNKRAFCPFCKGARSATFSVKNNHGLCFRCGESADTIKLVMQLTGLAFVAAVKSLQ